MLYSTSGGKIKATEFTRRQFLRSPKFWAVLALALSVVWPCVQISRFQRAHEPFGQVGAWLYTGGDDMGLPLLGPEGVREVYFEGKTIGDAELSRLMANLKRFPRLESLHLEHTLITDAILPQLAELPLRTLYISGTNVTAKGVAQFRRQASKCDVHWSQVTSSDTAVLIDIGRVSERDQRETPVESR